MRDDIFVETNKLVITTSVSTFTNHSLGNGVKRRELNLVILSRLGLLEVTKTLLERVEFADEDVGLVHFVCKDDQFLLGGEFENASDLFRAERSTCWVTRVNDGNGTGVDAFFLCLLERRLDALEARTPTRGLIKVVWNALCIEDGESGCVERVLWNWNEDTSVWCCADDMKEGIHATGGTSRKVN